MSLLLGAACSADDVTAVQAVDAPSLSAINYSDIVSVKIVAPSPTLAKGDTMRLTMVARDRWGKVVEGIPASWSSSHGYRARIDSTGLVTGVGLGGASIKLSTPAKTTYFYVTVVEPVAPAPEAPAEAVIALPAESPTDVAVQLVRFDGDSGEVLVSSGVPLAPGRLHPGQAGQVRLVVDGVERAISVTELPSHHPDGSLRSIVVQTRMAFGATERPTGRLALSSTRPDELTLSAEPFVAVPQAVVLPGDPNYLVSTDLVGPTITVEQSRALGSPFTRYENEFGPFADQHWANRGAYWGENYYDRVLIYYAFWVRSGNVEYWRRATELALAYRRDYLEKNSYGSSPHWAQLEGLEKHYLLTGDEKSRYAIAQVAGSAFNYWITRLGRTGLSNFESRIQARVLQAHLLAWRLDARGTRDKVWNDILPSLLDQVLSTQRSDGSYRFVATCYESLNYMSGMLNDVLISYHRYYRADQRIPPAVQRSVDWLWSTQWLPGSRAFKYISAPCEGVGQGGAAPDLNLMFVTGPAWLYQQTGDARYRDMADQIFSGGVGRGNLHASKQFNENYYASFKYLAYR
ncbi:MAG TPA: hypothetical protein VGE02_17005 [Gemmatimonadales bacterium]